MWAITEHYCNLLPGRSTLSKTAWQDLTDVLRCVRLGQNLKDFGSAGCLEGPVREGRALLSICCDFPECSSYTIVMHFIHNFLCMENQSMWKTVTPKLEGMTIITSMCHFFDLQYFQKLLNGCWKFNGGDNQFWLRIPHRLICGHCLLGMNIANTQRQPFLCTSSKFNEENKSRSAADALGQKPENHSSFSFPPPPKKCTFGLAVSGLEMLKQD